MKKIIVLCFAFLAVSLGSIIDSERFAALYSYSE